MINPFRFETCFNKILKLFGIFLILYFNFETFIKAFRFIHILINRHHRLQFLSISGKNFYWLELDTYQYKVSYYLVYLCKICEDIYYKYCIKMIFLENLLIL